MKSVKCLLGFHKWSKGGRLDRAPDHAKYFSTRVCERCLREEALFRGVGSDDWMEIRILRPNDVVMLSGENGPIRYVELTEDKPQVQQPKPHN